MTIELLEGRKDLQVKLVGERLNVEGLESVLSQHEGVKA